MVIEDDKILLIKREKPPSKGLWAVPGGRVNWGETLIQAVEREVWEETTIPIKAGQIIHTFDSITLDDQEHAQYHYVIIDFIAHPLTPDLQPQAADDAEDARWVSYQDLSQMSVSQPTLQLIQAHLYPSD